MRAESFNLHMARPVQNQRHFRTMLNGYLQKGKRFKAPLTRSEGLSTGAIEEEASLRLGGYFNMFSGITDAPNQDAALEFLSKWWLSRVKERKLKAHHLIFNVSEDFTREALGNGINLADHLPLMVDSTLGKYRDIFYQGENLAYVSEVRRDKEHPQCDCLVFPYTDSGTHISFSSNSRFPGCEDGLTRNMRAATKKLFQSEGKRISFIANNGQEEPGPGLREHRNCFIRTALAAGCSVENGVFKNMKTKEILEHMDKFFYLDREVDDEHNHQEMLARMELFSDSSASAIRAHFNGVREHIDSYPSRLGSLATVIKELDLKSAPSKDGSHSQRYRAILERRGAIAQLSRDLKDRACRKRLWDQRLALYVALGDEKACAAIGEKPYHARIVKGHAKLFPTFDEFHSQSLISGRMGEFLDQKAAILATMETPDNKSSANQHVAPPIFPDTTDWNFSEARRIALLSPNAPFHSYEKGRNPSKFPNFPDPDPIAFFLGIQRE